MTIMRSSIKKCNSPRHPERSEGSPRNKIISVFGITGLIRRSLAVLGMTFGAIVFLSGCAAHKTCNLIDPFEPVNRKIHAFNMAFDGALLRPAARVYKSVLPLPFRASVNHFFDNIYLLPTLASDVLQWDWHDASNDAGRFLINTTIGVAGLFDPATCFHIPLHKNDLGLTFAKWGYKKSFYIVIPFIGPSTIRDGVGMAVEYTFFTPYPYIYDNGLLWGIAALRAIDLRAQYLEMDKLLHESLDQYAFLRDAYLQNRHFLIYGEQDPNGGNASSDGSEGEANGGGGGVDYVDE